MSHILELLPIKPPLVAFCSDMTEASTLKGELALLLYLSVSVGKHSVRVTSFHFDGIREWAAVL